MHGDVEQPEGIPAYGARATFSCSEGYKWVREEPLMIWGGARAKAGKKKLNGYSPSKKKLNSKTLNKKKTQLNNPEEKKNSTQQPGRKKKLNSTTWKKKKAS